MLTSKNYTAFETVVNLTTLSATASKGKIINLNSSSKFGGAVILDSETPIGDSNVKIKGMLQTADGKPISGAGSLTIEVYSAASTDGSTALTKKIGTHGPYAAADLNKGEFLDAQIDCEAGGVLLLAVLGTAFESGSVRISVEA